MTSIDRRAESLHLAGPLLTEIPEMVTARLLATIAAATTRWGMSFEAIDHVARGRMLRVKGDTQGL